MKYIIRCENDEGPDDEDAFAGRHTGANLELGAASTSRVREILAAMSCPCGGTLRAWQAVGGSGDRVPARTDDTGLVYQDIDPSDEAGLVLVHEDDLDGPAQWEVQLSGEVVFSTEEEARWALQEYAIGIYRNVAGGNHPVRYDPRLIELLCEARTYIDAAVEYAEEEFHDDELDESQRWLAGRDVAGRLDSWIAEMKSTASADGSREEEIDHG